MVLNVKEIAELVALVSDDIAALVLIIVGSYIAIKMDYDNGSALISLGVAYLFGSHVPKKPKSRGEN